MAESLAARLKMHCYLKKLESYEDRDEVLKYCVVCLDSLSRYLNPVRHKYDVVVIDETEQVYSHVLSDTLAGNKRKYCFNLLHLYIRRARQVVLCDADLGWLTFNVTAPTTKAAPTTPTKMELATKIYKRMRSVKDVSRKDTIEKFIAEVKLTKAGASTYYQMIKDKHEPMGKK
ncbi:MULTISPECIES: hypothetical protein [Streptomyces]|uniref:hypothetical protein n=5 Tax=Streptomyces TaxID=1883 RepID=UPI0033A9959A